MHCEFVGVLTMANFTTSPNMQLQIPTVGLEAGPQYATDVNNSLTIIDGHNHSAGSGVLINPSGININSDLPINGNSLTLIFTARFQSQTLPIPNTAPNIGCIYVAGNELYYNDFSGGHSVQITNNGSVNAGAGSITGLPSGTAGVTFAGSTYVFQSATNTAATIDVASVILRNTTPSSFGLTLSPPNALGSNYTVTLPGLPGVTSVMTLDASGNMGTVTYDQVGQNMTSVGANAIQVTTTRPVGTVVGTGGVAISASCGNYVTSSTSFTIITNLSVGLTTSGRPVMLVLQDDASGSQSFIAQNTGGASPINMNFAFFRDSSQITNTVLVQANGQSGGTFPANLTQVDVPPAGSHTYTMQVKVVADQVAVNHAVLVAYEL
jgi:hypothetical protein